MRPTTGSQQRPALDPALKNSFLCLIERRFGLHLSEQQGQGLDEAVQRLLAGSAYADPVALYGAFAAGRSLDLFEKLAAALTIGETHFFRVGPQMEALRRVVLPDVIARRAGERRLRLWSAGCASGEEPATLAILVREGLPLADEWDAQILATDISHAALEAGRRATYGEWSFRDTPDEVRRRHFTPEGTRWRLVEPLRRMVHFAQLNLAADTFPSADVAGSGFDVILCRNVTIYFSMEATQRLYRRFADALARGGWLVLGPSDPSPQLPGPLAPVYLPGAVLWRRPADAAVRPASPHVPGQRQKSPPPGRPLAPADRLGPAGGRPAPAGAPGEASADLKRVRALAHGGNRTAAREAAERLARAQPLVAEAHLLLGMLYLDVGAVEPAAESLRRAAFIDPHNPLTQFGLARACLRRGDEVRARTMLTHTRRLLAPAPDDQAIAGGGGLQAGELRQALEVQLASLEPVAGSPATR